MYRATLSCQIVSIRALYARNGVVLWTVRIIFLVWLGVNAWLLTTGTGRRFTPVFQSCSDNDHRGRAYTRVALYVTTSPVRDATDDAYQHAR